MGNFAAMASFVKNYWNSGPIISRSLARYSDNVFFNQFCPTQLVIYNSERPSDKILAPG